MTLDQLRIFLAVAEREHVTRAAEVLRLTQSAVSAAIQALEARHDLQLFHRVGRRIELTAAGREFVPIARSVLAGAELAELNLAELAGMKRGQLRLCSSQTIGGYWLPAALIQFKAAYPAIEISLDIGNTEHVAKCVLAGEVELGLIEGRVDEPALAEIPVATDRVVVVVGKSHPWANAPGSVPQRLEDAKWVLRERGSGTRSTFDEGLSILGMTLPETAIALQLPSNEAVRTAAVSGPFATALSEVVVRPSIASGALIRLPIELPERQFTVIHRDGRQLSRLALTTIRWLQDFGRR